MILEQQARGSWLRATRSTGGGAIKGDSTTLEIEQRNRRGERSILVKLSGEFDVRCQKILADVLGDCLTTDLPTSVDLSGVTFMDSRCVEELAVHYQLGQGRLALCDPSRQVELGVTACGLEEWIGFVHTTRRSGGWR
jgi:anti-anti-sigma factor